MANLTYRYRIYPNKTQEQALDFAFSMGCRIWNDALHMRKVAWEQEQKSMSLYDLRDYWCGLRHLHAELAILPSATVDALCRRLEKAYKAFFRRLKAGEPDAGFPKNKKRHDFTSLDYVYGKGVKFMAEKPGVGRLRLFKVGDVRLHYHRPLPNGTAIKMVVVNKDKQGGGFCILPRKCLVETI